MQGFTHKGWGYRSIALLVLFAAATVAGCGGNGMSTVAGTVTVDGKPLEQGAISFVPADGEGPTAGATIEDGKYMTQAPPGQKKVKITGFEITGQVPAYKGMKNSPMRDIVKEIVPDKYNIQTELNLTIESTDTTGDFDLESS